MTFLALDVGNTRLKWAQYEAPAVGAKLLAQGAVFLEKAHAKNLDDRGITVAAELFAALAVRRASPP